VGPRLNAAGRLDDMSLGIDCLLADDAEAAQRMAQQLHELNLERRNIEADMHDTALASLEQIEVADRYSLSLYSEDWHQGVIGILASRIKERYYRPVIAFADAGDGLLKGSGRSISGLHLRDALDLVSKRKPQLLVKFGGHAMAAGLTIRAADLESFVASFEAVVRELLSPADLESVIEIDGALDSRDIGWDTACAIERQVWGQGFPLPLFSDRFRVLDQRIVGERHLKLVLEKQGRRFDAIFFQQQEYLPTEVQAVYQLQTNQYNGVQAVQLSLRHWQPVS
jgi:single-stranded-DNA-specific exonuclease